MEKLFRTEETPYKLQGYSLRSFATLDQTDDIFVVSYSIFPEEFQKPTPVGFIIIKPTLFAVFTYYDKYNDVWIVEDKCTLENDCDTVESKISFVEDSVVCYEPDCDSVIDVHDTMRETLKTKYNIGSVEPIEIANGVDEDVSMTKCESCETEEFEYHDSDENADISLYLCENCHNITYIEFSGLKHTPDDINVDVIREKSAVHTIPVTDSKNILQASDSPSFFDSYVAYIWWKAFKQSGGLEKYAPDLENAVLFTKDGSVVGFIAWNTLKDIPTPVIQNAYFIPTISDEEIQEYYETFMEKFDFEKLLIHRSIQDIPSNPYNFDLNTESVIVINPNIITDSQKPISKIL